MGFQPRSDRARTSSAEAGLTGNGFHRAISDEAGSLHCGGNLAVPIGPSKRQRLAICVKWVVARTAGRAVRAEIVTPESPEKPHRWTKRSEVSHWSPCEPERSCRWRPKWATGAIERAPIHKPRGVAAALCQEEVTRTVSSTVTEIERVAPSRENK